MLIKIVMSLCLFTISCMQLIGQQERSNETSVLNSTENIYSEEQLVLLLETPPCLAGYRTNQTGYLSKLDSTEFGTLDTTFTVEKIKVPGEGLMINGWLYLPIGNGRHPLIILTNGGGNNVDGSTPI